MASKAVGLLVCVLILALDIVAGILGIKAEAEQDKVQIHFTFNYIKNVMKNDNLC